VLASAREMVESGHAERLTDLIYAATPQERRLLDRFGLLLGALQDLATEVQRTYPGEIRQLRERAREAAARGEADDALSRAFTGRSPIERGEGDPGRVLNEMLLSVLSDPYAFLDEQSGRLTAVPIADDMAALQWDGRPIFGPLVGLTLKESDGRWQLVLPTHLGPVQEILADDEMVGMLEELIAVFTNTVRDVREDVRSGQARTLEEVASRAGEDAVLPLGLVMIAIGKYQENVREEAGSEEGDGQATEAPEAPDDAG
jgi:hypothetical protein